MQTGKHADETPRSKLLRISRHRLLVSSHPAADTYGYRANGMGCPGRKKSTSSAGADGGERRDRTKSDEDGTDGAHYLGMFGN